MHFSDLNTTNCFQSIKSTEWKYNSQFLPSNFDSTFMSDPINSTTHETYLNGAGNQFSSNHFSSNHFSSNHFSSNQFTSNQFTNNQFTCNQFTANHSTMANSYGSIETSTYSPLPSPPTRPNLHHQQQQQHPHLETNSTHFTNQLNNQFKNQFNHFNLPLNHASHLNTFHYGLNTPNSLYSDSNVTSGPISLTPPSDSPPSSSNFNSSDILLRDEDDDDTATVISNAESMNNHFSYDLLSKIHYNSSNSQPPPGKTRTRDKYRVVYSDTQRVELESEYHSSKYITIGRKSELAKKLNLSERQVKIWFQNRRAKERKEAKKQPTFISQF